MPSGSKKRRAAKRKKELEANQNHATNQQAHAENTSGIENVTDEGLAEPVEGLSEVVVCSNNLVADANVTFGAEDNQGEALQSIDALTSNPQSDVVSGLKITVQFSSKIVAPILAEEQALGEGEVQLKESALSEEVDHVDEATLESSTESREAASCEGVGCNNVGVAQDALKECEASSMAPYADELDSNPLTSFVTVLSRNEQVLPQLGEDSGVMPMRIVTMEKTLNLSSGGGSSERENIVDSYMHQSPESSSGLKQIYFACPLHCDSSCRLKHGVVSSCEEQDARDDGKMLGAVEQLERLKNNIEAELHVAEKVSVLCRKLLDDLNAI